MYILDSSAIAIALKRFKKRSIEVISDNITLDLARYELGNVIWKEYALKRTTKLKEAINKAGKMARILEVMRVESLASEEDLKNAEKIAAELNLTFYDASYLYAAKRDGLKLVTEDIELLEKAERADVEAITINDMLSVEASNSS